MTMVVRVFDTLTAAQRAVADLVGSGYARNAISILVRDALAHRMPPCDDGERGALAQATSIIAGGPLGDVLHRGTDTVSPRAVTQCLRLAGVQSSAAEFFADAISHGAILVAVHCDDGDVRYAREILDVDDPYGAVTGWLERKQRNQRKQRIERIHEWLVERFVERFADRFVERHERFVEFVRLGIDVGHRIGQFERQVEEGVTSM